MVDVLSSVKEKYFSHFFPSFQPFLCYEHSFVFSYLRIVVSREGSAITLNNVTSDIAQHASVKRITFPRITGPNVKILLGWPNLKWLRTN